MHYHKVKPYIRSLKAIVIINMKNTVKQEQQNYRNLAIKTEQFRVAPGSGFACLSQDECITE